MGKAIRIVGVVAALVVCAASATPYQEKGFRGGVSHTAISPGVWSITADGNAYTNRSTLVEYSHRRAGELCPGGYDVLDKDSNTQTYGCGEYNCDKSDTALVVRCHDNRANSTAAPGGAASLPRY